MAYHAEPEAEAKGKGDGWKWKWMEMDRKANGLKRWIKKKERKKERKWMNEKGTGLKKVMKKQTGWKVSGWKIEMSRESSELKRTWMEKVFDRKGNDWKKKRNFILYILRFSHQILLWEKRFGFYFHQSETRNEFLTREKIVSSNHKPRLSELCLRGLFRGHRG